MPIVPVKYHPDPEEKKPRSQCRRGLSIWYGGMSYRTPIMFLALTKSGGSCWSPGWSGEACAQASRLTGRCYLVMPGAGPTGVQASPPGVP